MSAKNTAIRRSAPSAPARWLLQNRESWVWGSVLDYGCGHGRDVEAYHTVPECVAAGWDPYHAKGGVGMMSQIQGWHPLVPQYDTVTCTYVLNVISAAEQESVLASIVNRTYPDVGRAIVTVRRDIPRGGTKTQRWVELSRYDGWLPVHHERGRWEMYWKTP